MARIQVNWEEPSIGGGYEGYDAENLLTGLPDEYGESGKPLVVYLESSLPDDMIETAVVNQTVLPDEKIAIGMKMFNLVKMNGLKITKEHPYAKHLYGKELPRMVVVGADGKKIGTVEGKISPSKVFGLMKRASKQTYKTNIETFIKDYQKVLTDIDKVEAKKAALATRRQTSKNISKSKERMFAKEEEKITKEENEVLEREEKILKSRRRDEKLTKANP